MKGHPEYSYTSIPLSSTLLEWVPASRCSKHLQTPHQGHHHYMVQFPQVPHFLNPVQLRATARQPTQTQSQKSQKSQKDQQEQLSARLWVQLSEHLSERQWARPSPL